MQAQPTVMTAVDRGSPPCTSCFLLLESAPALPHAGGTCDCVLLEFRPATAYHLSAALPTLGEEAFGEGMGERGRPNLRDFSHLPMHTPLGHASRLLAGHHPTRCVPANP